MWNMFGKKKDTASPSKDAPKPQPESPKSPPPKQQPAQPASVEAQLQKLMGMSLINQPGTFEYEHRQISEKIANLKQDVENYLNTLRTSPTLPDNANKELAKYEDALEKLTIACDNLKPSNDQHKAMRKQLIVEIQKSLSIVDATKETVAKGIKPSM